MRSRKPATSMAVSALDVSGQRSLELSDTQGRCGVGGGGIVQARASAAGAVPPCSSAILREKVAGKDRDGVEHACDFSEFAPLAALRPACAGEEGCEGNPNLCG
jgi:hypothetical protein